MASPIDPVPVLIVDDDEQIRRAVERLLRENGYEVAAASGAAEARSLMKDLEFPLLVLDINMPGESGIELLGYLRSEHPDTAVVMLTAVSDPKTASIAFDAGAYGYLVKPFRPEEVLINVANAIHRRRLELERRTYTEELERKALERSAALNDAIERLKKAKTDVEHTQQEIVERLAVALQLRDEETGRHIERMSRYAEVLARRLDGKGFSKMIRLASPLHDIGKIAIPDAILQKPGPLTPDEYAVVKGHAEIGHRLLAGSQAEGLMLAASIALTHHEKWDGSGYPRGLAGAAIPLEGRVAAVADVFDALTHRRAYRGAYSMEEASAMLRAERGTHFDPKLVDEFFDSIDQVLAIHESLPEESDEKRQEPIRVLLVDDHEMFSQSLLRILGAEVDLEVVGTARTAREARELARDLSPDVILIDYGLPDEDGATAAAAIKSDRPETKLVMVTGFAEDPVLVAAIEAGCSGFVTKTKAVGEVVQAVRAAYAGEALISPAMLVRLLPKLRPSSRGVGSALTRRELEILELLASGLSNQAIADRLVLSLRTVRNHVQNIIRKLGAHSKLEAVSAAAREGIIQFPGEGPKAARSP